MVQHHQQGTKPGRYPWKGFEYFLAHPALWSLVICPLVIAAVFLILALILLFALAYRPQADLLLDTAMPAWAAYLVTVFIVLTEVLIATFLFVQILFGQYQDKLFDKVLELENKVIEDRSNIIKSAFANIGLAIAETTLFVVTIPVNIMPVVGTFAFCYINGFLSGWSIHMHYFELKGMSFFEQLEFVKARKHDYSVFGTAALFLQVIPIVNLLFSFTNVVGGALWAIELEQDDNIRVLEAPS